MAKIRSLVKVKVFREFEYPKSMLNKESFLQDALSKARSDMQIFVDEIVGNDHGSINHEMFMYEAVEELGYKFRNREMLQDNPKDKVSFAKAAKLLTTRAIEAKYGPLNPETNPDLYEHDPEVRSQDGETIIREEQWFMKSKISDEFYEVYDFNVRLLRSVQ